MSDAEVPADVQDAWQRALEAWDDATRHEALLGVMARRQCFAWVAARYRERAGDAIADRQLERIRLTATATLLGAAPRRDAGPTPYRSSIITLGILIVMIVVGLVYAMVIRQTQPVTDTHGVTH